MMPRPEAPPTGGSCPSSASGNGHMLMMDRNSDQVAQMIQKWMTDKGLMN